MLQQLEAARIEILDEQTRRAGGRPGTRLR
jgi:hypothetical protein